MKLQTASDLLYGSLDLFYPNTQLQLPVTYTATSGCTQWQQPEDQSARARGPIPAGNYEIPTTPEWVDTRGIEGWFFHITPDPVKIDGVIRGEFGIHFDANVPGSAGCIVLRNLSGWQKFCERMEAIAKSGVTSIPLAVSYS